MYKTKLLNKIDYFVGKKYFSYVIIALAASVAYSNSFTVPFHLDDFGSIANNNSIHEMFLFSDMWNFYANRIVLYFTFSLNYVLFGNYLWSYHAVNLLIHIFNGMLLYKLLVKLLCLPYFTNKPASEYRRLIGLMSALLFICHPIQVNAVTYIIQRTASLAAAFYLLSINFYLDYRITGKIYRLLAVFISIVAAMYTKENTFTIPFMLLLIEIMFFLLPRYKLKTWKKLLIFLLIFSTLPIIPLTNMLFHGHSLSDPDVTFKASTSMGRLQYFYTQLNVLLHYIRLLVIPIGQNFDYSNDYPISATLWDNYSYVSLAVLSMIFVFALFCYKRNRLVTLGVFWFFLCIAVESSFISIKDVYFEHRVYLPAAGFIMFLAGMLTFERKVHPYKFAVTLHDMKFSFAGAEWHTNLFRQPILLYLYMSLALIPIYTGLTIYRNYIYSDSIRLWSDTVSKAPNSDRAHNSLATAYLNAYSSKKNNIESLEIAEKEFKTALKINDKNSTAHSNLSKVYLLKGMYQDCIIEAKRALKLSKSEYAQYNLGSAYIKTGRTNEGLSAFLEGYAYNNQSSIILEALGDTYYDLYDFDNAKKYYEKYVEANKSYKNAKILERLDEINQFAAHVS